MDKIVNGLYNQYKVTNLEENDCYTACTECKKQCKLGEHMNNILQYSPSKIL